MQHQAHSNANSIDESEDWEALSQPKAHEADHDSGNNRYIHFQLNSRFGRLSYLARLGTAETENMAGSTSEFVEGPTHQQEHSPLFRIPAEIRLHIYELLFRIPTGDQGVKLRRGGHSHSHPMSVLALILTCRRLKDEAEELFYGTNRIFVDDTDILGSLGRRRRDAMTSVAVPAQSAGALLARLQDVQQLSNLQSLHIIRTLSVKYIDPRSWAVMAPQIMAEIKKMKALKEVKFITPEAKDLTEHELASQSRLSEIDARIRNAVQSV